MATQSFKLSALRKGVKVAAGEPVTVVVEDALTCIRMQGMLFDTNKSFLLPSAMIGIRKVVKVYEENPGGEMVVAGHTDRVADPAYNDVLSLERAKSVVAFLKDDVEAWMKFYGQGVSEKKRWGDPESLMMIRSLPGMPQDLSDEDTIRRFQEENKDRFDLGEPPVDGICGEKTRRAVITRYMGHDGTSLPASIRVLAHGCGEHFPLDKTPGAPEENAKDRRVEVFAFPEKITPEPKKQNSGPKDPEYPAWNDAVVRLIDASKVGEALKLVFQDPLGEPAANRKVSITLPGRAAQEMNTGEAGEIAFDEVLEGPVTIALVPDPEAPAPPPDAAPAKAGGNGELELKNADSGVVLTRGTVKVIVPKDTLENALFKRFLERFEALIAADRPQVEAALKTIYGNQLKAAVLKDLMEKADLRKKIRPDRVFSVAADSLKGSDGCYLRSKKWVILREDLAEAAWKEEGLGFRQATITVEDTFENPTQEKPDPWFPQGDLDTFDALWNLYLEELGHHMDQFIQLQGHRDYFDTIGDEGELFSILMFLGADRLAAGDPLFTEDELIHAQRESDIGIGSVTAGAESVTDDFLEFQNNFGRITSPAAEPKVALIEIFVVDDPLGDQTGFIDFHTSDRILRYDLDKASGLLPGEFGARVKVEPPGSEIDVRFTFLPNPDVDAGQFNFFWKLKAGQPNPRTLLANQGFVPIFVSTDAAPTPESKPKSEDPPSNTVFLSALELLEGCAANSLPGIKVFPWRGTRFGSAPIIAHRDGDDIVVRQPVYVLADDNFKAQTRTIANSGVYSGGLRMNPNEIVRIRVYEPHWYTLNITGDASGDKQEEFCIRAEELLYFNDASISATKMNMVLTAVDAATFFVPVGKIATQIGARALRFAGPRGAAILSAAMIGMREAAPATFGGLAARQSVVWVEEQAVIQASRSSASTTATHMAIEFSGRRAPEVVLNSGLPVGARLAGETAKITIVDQVGATAVHTVVAPTGDAELDRMLDEAFYDVPGPVGPAAPGQGLVLVAPEIAAGFTQASINAFRRFLAKSFAKPEMSLLKTLWDGARKDAQAAILNAGNSRRLFNLHRDRFWTAVRGNPTARKMFEDAGCQFTDGAPFFTLNGERFTLNIDHIIERQTNPALALTADNLRIIFPRENSVVVRLINQMDKFQNPP